MSKQAEPWDGSREYFRGDEVTRNGVTFRAMEYIHNELIQPYVSPHPTRWEKVEQPEPKQEKSEEPSHAEVVPLDEQKKK